MSLQVWLPLTKDLRQQGVSNASVVNNGATYSSTGGKLGGCYSFDGTDDRIAIVGLSLPNTWSYGCWFYSATSTRGWEGVITLNSSSGDTDNQLGFYTYPTSSRIQNTANGQWNSAITYTTGQWNHFFGTFDGSNLKTYINGILVDTKAITNSLLSRSNLTIGGRSSSAAGGNTSITLPFQGKINDVRIYDDCLSAEEVKRISQGLILHYPLNHMGLGQENLLKGTDILEITNNINTGVGGWDNISTLTTTDDGVKLTGRSGSPCIGVPLANTGSINNNEPYTLSFKYRTNKAIGMNFYYIESSGSNISIYNSVPTEISTTEWKDFKWTITSSTVADRIPRAILMFYAFSSNSSDWVEIKRGSLKLEKGSIATPWSPAPNDTSYSQMGLDSNIEYDTSGYCNNGVRTGTFTWSSDVPKYSVSTIFKGTEVIATDSLPLETLTIACWVKVTTIPSGYGIIYVDTNTQTALGFYNGNSFITSCITSANLAMLGSTFQANEWNYLVLVKTGANTRNVYCNGQLLTNSSSNSWTHQGNNLQLGKREYSGGNAGYLNGQMCDFRAYATALSADDVKSLYQNCATIDSNGTIYGQIRT